MRFSKGLILPALFIALATSTMAQTETAVDSATVAFSQGRTELLMKHGNNAEELDGFSRRVAARDTLTPRMRLKEVRIVGGASPEGSLRFNRWLSERRAERIADYLLPRMDVDSAMISTKFLGRDWQGVLTLARQERNLPYRDETLSLLEQIVAEIDSLGDEQESLKALTRLKHLRGAEPYIYLYYHVFPAVRASKLIAIYNNELRGTALTAGDVLSTGNLMDIITPKFELPRVMPVEVPAPLKPFYMAVYTNMLLDAALIPNLGADFYLGKNVSINGSWMYSWWKTDVHHRYWRTYGGYLEPRWWFGKAAGRKPLTGHHLGIYGQISTYDFELGNRGYLGPKWSWGAGVSYGYSLPVAKRLNIDFTLGVGYFGGKYYEYLPIDNCYVWQVTKQRHWFGPTKAEISLVWLIGRGNYNKKYTRR